MAGWAGFTDEDLRKIRQPSPENGRAQTAQVRKQTSQNKKPKLPRERLINKTEESTGLDPSQRLSQPKSPLGVVNDRVSSARPENVPDQKKSPDVEKRKEESDHEQVSRELNDQEVKNAEFSNMEKFQKQQKMIEEANKQKKALLSKTINERRLKAKAESVKLTKIQKELSHLDTLLTADVSLIRDKIEIASMEFLDAQKRYDKAEKEVITAKMNLFEKGELKERLTEHLYTIIHQNEVRKGKKLVELMEILSMEISAEEMELQVTSIPALTNFNSVHTLTSPTRKQSESETQNSSAQLPTSPINNQPQSETQSSSAQKSTSPINNQPQSQKQESQSTSTAAEQTEIQSKGDNAHEQPAQKADVLEHVTKASDKVSEVEQTLTKEKQTSEETTLNNNNAIKPAQSEDIKKQENNIET